MEDLKIEYTKKLHRGEPISYKFLTYNAQIRDLTLSLISQYLAEMHLVHIRSSIFTFVSEAINNGVKANLKRVYFDSLNADIHDNDSYLENMQDFKQALLNIDDYSDQLKEQGRSVQVYMHQKNDDLQISVSNNTGMTEDELNRVQSRITNASKINSMEDALEYFVDTTEGGGLGLIMTIIMLKKSGIDPGSNFSLNSENDTTRSTLHIPSGISKPAYLREIERKIVAEIEMIPPFPDTVQRVLRLCDMPDSDMSQVAAAIQRDPALTADVLKIVNSAAFVTNQRIKSLSIAVTRMGLKAIRELTIASASFKILATRYRIYQDFWEHSFRAGFYAKMIAELQNLDLEAEMVYLGGLLHDMGKIIMYSLNPSIMNNIKGLDVDKVRANSAILEEMSIGVSHAHIGAVVAEHWGFSPELVEIIRNHHRPFISDKDYKLETAVIHIADALINIEMKRGNYVYMDVEALHMIGLYEMDQVNEMHKTLQKAFEDHLEHARKAKLSE